MSTAFFDTFRRATTIEATVVCETALRIGAGRSADSLGADLPVLKDASGRPFLPGSSIKGVLRSHAEALVRASGLDACDPFVEPCLDDKKASKFQGDPRERAGQLRDWVAAEACVACRVFGAPHLASHVTFADARCEGDVSTEVRDGVAIDRDLGRVSGSRKYDFEVVPPGTRFGFRLLLDDLDAWGEGLVAATLELLHEGHARLGGFKSRGLGLVSLQDRRVRVLEGAGLVRSEPGWDKWSEERLRAWSDFRASAAAGTSAGEASPC